MKRYILIGINILLILLSLSICVDYTVSFCQNVQSYATQHLDDPVLLPLLFLCFSLIIGLGTLIVKKIKPCSGFIFVLPLIFFLTGIITLFIGSGTSCPYCG